MTRTTATVTTLEGSPALNVIASTARAGVNVRVLVGDTVASVVEHVRRAIHDDAVTVEVVEAGEPSPVSPVDDDAFRLLTSTIEEQFPDAVATPYIMMGATDARFFTALLPAGLPVHAVPDVPGPAREPAQLRRADRRRRPRRRDAVVPTPPRAAPAS